MPLHIRRNGKKYDMIHIIPPHCIARTAMNVKWYISFHLIALQEWQKIWINTNHSISKHVGRNGTQFKITSRHIIAYHYIMTYRQEWQLKFFISLQIIASRAYGHGRHCLLACLLAGWFAVEKYYTGNLYRRAGWAKSYRTWTISPKTRDRSPETLAKRKFVFFLDQPSPTHRVFFSLAPYWSGQCW